MWAWAKIYKILRMLVVVLPLIFVLTSCAKEAAVQTDKSDEALAAEHSACWQDRILKDIYEAMGSMSMSLYQDITQGALKLEMIAFAIWFALRLMKFVSSITPENSGEVWNEVLKKFFWCLFCGTLASSTDGCLWVMSTLIFPIYNAFLEFGGEILGSIGTGYGQETLQVLGTSITVNQNTICQAGRGAFEVTLDGFPDSPMEMMNCLICLFNERLSLGNYIAFRIMRTSAFMNIINGLILLVAFMVIKLSFVFYLVDNIFKFGVMVVMMPILILFYPFQKKWAVFGVKTILSSAAFMMSISIMMAICMKALLEIIIQNPDVFNPPDSIKEVTFAGRTFLSILLLAFLVWSTVKIAREITNAIVDTQIDNSFQGKLLGLGLLLLGWLTGGLGAAFGKMKMVQQARAAYQKTAWARNLKNARDKYNKVSATLDDWAGRNQE